MSQNYITLKPSYINSGELKLPGSKSISNRVLLLSSLGKGKTNIKNLLFSDDTNYMLSALSKLGVKIETNKLSNECFIEGCENSFPNKNASLYIGNAGTVIRPLTAALAFNQGNYKLHGTKRMHERPIGDLVESLNLLGANIKYLDKINYPPISINKSIQKSHSVKIKGNKSSQYLSSLILSSTLLSKKNDLLVQVDGELISKPYVEITLKLMKLFGLEIKENKKNKFIITSNQLLINPEIINVEGDASSASYFLAASAISGKSLKIYGIGTNSIQGDVKFIEILKKMGANVIINENSIDVSCNKKLKPINEDLNHIPDAAMTIAILALYAEGISIIKNIGSWRVKETDRLYAMTTELRKVGAKVIEGDDFLKIEPPLEIKDAIIDTYNDHRMAMCFSLASINGLYKKGANIKINDPDCVSKTFPNYFNVFNNLMK